MEDPLSSHILENVTEINVKLEYPDPSKCEAFEASLIGSRTCQILEDCSVQLSSITKFEVSDEDEEPSVEDEVEGDSIEDELQTINQVRIPKSSLKCEICDKQLATQWSLTRHMRFHAGEKPHQCTMCDTKFREKSDLTSHIKRRHIEEKPYKCSVCDKEFSLKSDLAPHMKRHTGEKPHQCSICNKHFLTKWQVTLHTRHHTGEKPHQCTICDQKFACKSHFGRHCRKHEEQKKREAEMQDRPTVQLCIGTKSEFPDEEDKADENGDDANRPFQLSSVANFDEYLNGNLKKHLFEKYNSSESRKLRFACGLCDMKCASKVNLDEHMLKIHHLRPKTSLKCTVCDKGFAAKKNLSQHISKVHGEKTFKCDVCGKRFALAYSLKNHMEIHRPIFQDIFTEKPASSEFQQVVLVNLPTLVLVVPPVDPLSLETTCVESTVSQSKYWPPAEQEIREDDPIFAEAWDCQKSSGTEEHELQVIVDPVFVESCVESPDSKTYGLPDNELCSK